MTNKAKNLIITFMLGLIVVFICCISPSSSDTPVLNRLIDGCFVSGVLIGGAGVMAFCSSRGAFDIFGYGIMYGVSLILPVGKNPWLSNGNRESYYDYRERKREKKRKPFGAMLIIGGVYLALSVLLLIPYSIMSKGPSVEKFADPAATVMTQEQLDQCSSWFNEKENNGLLHGVYTNASQQSEEIASYLEVILHGLGEADFTEEEAELLGEKAAGRLRVKREEIVAHLVEKFGMSEEAAKLLADDPENFPSSVYLEETDAWYIVYDYVLYMTRTFERGEIRADGTVRLFYHNEMITMEEPDGSVSYESNVLMAVTLRCTDGVWQIVSNEIMK